MKDTTKQVLAFQVGGRDYAIPLDFVVSVEKAVKITSVPGSDTTSFNGIVAFGGEIYHLLHLHLRFIHQQPEVTIDQFMIFVKESDFKWVILVDEIMGLTDYKADEEFSKDVVSTNETRKEVSGESYTVSTTLGSLILLEHLNEIETNSN